MIKKLFGAATLVAALSISVMAFTGGAESGLKVGEFVTAFHPHHITGPHKGTDTCPPCTYGVLPAVQVWVNGDDLKNVEAITKLLNDRVGNWEKSKFKAFVIVVASPDKKAAAIKEIETIAAKTSSKIPIAWIEKNNDAIGAYKVNTNAVVKNTILVYKDMKVSAKFTNLTANEKGLADLNAAIDGITR